MCHTHSASAQQIDGARLLTEAFVPGAYYFNLGAEADAQGRHFAAFGWYVLGDVEFGLSVFTAGIGMLVAAPTRATTATVRVTSSGLARVESHLDAVLVNQQIPKVIQTGERAMLERLRSG